MKDYHNTNIILTLFNIPFLLFLSFILFLFINVDKVCALTQTSIIQGSLPGNLQSYLARSNTTSVSYNMMFEQLKDIAFFYYSNEYDIKEKTLYTVEGTVTMSLIPPDDVSGNGITCSNLIPSFKFMLFSGNGTIQSLMHSRFKINSCNDYISNGTVNSVTNVKITFGGEFIASGTTDVATFTIDFPKMNNTAFDFNLQFFNSSLEIEESKDSSQQIIDNANQNTSDIIDNQNKNQQETNNKLDEVNETNKGILGFIKSILDGIIHLPENIWNFIKGGFELISNAISGLFEGLKNIFVPEPQCRNSYNLFDGSVENGSYSFKTGSKLSDGNSFRSVNRISVNPDTSYIFSNDGSGVAMNVFQYTQDGTFISATYIAPNSSFKTTSTTYYITFARNRGDFTKIMLAEGTLISNYEEPGEICEKTSFWTWFERLGNMIGNFFTGLLNGILDGLKSLFIPSEDDLNDIINKSTEISENFGFVGESFAFIIRLFTSICGMINGDGCLILPSLELKFGGILGLEDYILWEETNVCMSDNPWFGKNSEGIDIVRTLTTGTLVCAYIGFAMSQLNKILSKEDTEV